MGPLFVLIVIFLHAESDHRVSMVCVYTRCPFICGVVDVIGCPLLWLSFQYDIFVISWVYKQSLLTASGKINVGGQQHACV